MTATNVNTKRLNKDFWTNIMRLKLLDTVDSSPRFVLEKSPFSDYDEEEIDEGTYTERDEYLIIGQIFSQSELYKDGRIKIEMIVTSNYPNEPPRVRFLTPVYHPNIEPNGTFCHQLISHKSRWKKGTTLVEVIQEVVKHLDEPDADYAFSFDIGEEYANNREEFNRKAKLSVEPYVVEDVVPEPVVLIDKTDAEPNTSNDQTDGLDLVEIAETNPIEENVQMDLDLINEISETNGNESFINTLDEPNVIPETEQNRNEPEDEVDKNEMKNGFINNVANSCTIS